MAQVWPNALRFIPGAFGLFFALVLLSCNSRPEGVDFIFLNGGEPQSLDPAIVTGQLDGRICNALYEGLTTRNAKGKAIPGSATHWDVSDDGLTYTFHLRKEARWSNGEPVTAKDFENSWRRALAPETGSRYAEIMFFIEGAEEFNSGKLTDFSKVGIKALDSHTLEVTLKAPAAFFPDLVAFTTYLPVYTPGIEKHGTGWMKPHNLVTNGAYTLKSWRINDRIVLSKNLHYWRKDKVAFETVVALATSKNTTAFNLYATGQADLILDKTLVPQNLMGILRERPDCHANPFLATYFFRFNVTRPPFDDVRIRRAFSLAANKTTIVEKITKGGEPIARSFTPPGIPGYEPPQGLGYDTAKARALMAEAGYPGGKGFPRVSLLYNTTELSKQIAVELQAMWSKQLGVHVELRNQEWATYLKSLDSLDFDIARSSWVGDYNDPNTFLDCFVTGRGNNRTGWSHARYDELMEQASHERDPEKRFALMHEAETILVREDIPILPLYYFVGTTFYDADKLGGIHPNVVDEHPISEMHWKDSRP